ncbi:hypothetical protein Nepgr_002834 [Nepenthes gracilis]|uniref:Uncharacterized protein n=1 Tax=Nepenthes gracilis TaxID=150966 RepID=A0AAD3RYL0_NEPGR|nr:hypothetical protein Nepgr_002834 [Nepenthes gracilis]
MMKQVIFRLDAEMASRMLWHVIGYGLRYMLTDLLITEMHDSPRSFAEVQWLPWGASAGCFGGELPTCGKDADICCLLPEVAAGIADASSLSSYCLVVMLLRSMLRNKDLAVVLVGSVVICCSAMAVCRVVCLRTGVFD